MWLKKKWSKWLPFGKYEYGGVEYVVFVRKNLTNGMMSFKTKRVHPYNGGHNRPFLSKLEIDPTASWNEIIKI